MNNYFDINYIWNSYNEEDWDNVLYSYNERVKTQNIRLEEELEENLHKICKIDDLYKLNLGNSWYDFLLNKYFRWKYTQPNRYTLYNKSI